MGITQLAVLNSLKKQVYSYLILQSVINIFIVWKYLKSRL